MISNPKTATTIAITCEASPGLVQWTYSAAHADLGLSGAGASHRQGFRDLVARVTLGEIGLILSIEVTRLARNCSDWYRCSTYAVIAAV